MRNMFINFTIPQLQRFCEWRNIWPVCANIYQQGAILVHYQQEYSDRHKFKKRHLQHCYDVDFWNFAELIFIHGWCYLVHDTDQEHRCFRYCRFGSPSEDGC